MFSSMRYRLLGLVPEVPEKELVKLRLEHGPVTVDAEVMGLALYTDANPNP